MFTLFSGYESQMMGLLDAVKKFNNRFKAGNYSAPYKKLLVNKL